MGIEPEEKPRGGAQADEWPAIIAARYIRRKFLENLRSDGDSYNRILRRFNAALRDEVSRLRIDLWIQTFATDEVRRLWNGGEPAEPDIDRLFERLLGLALMRPIVASAPMDSAVFYTAIDYHLLKGDTKQLILESVVVPPGLGSVGKCLRDGSHCVGISFGDYAGIVEWQDLIQGQTSILMVLYDANLDRGLKLPFVGMAFLPVPYVFVAEQDGRRDYRQRPNVCSICLRALKAALEDPDLTSMVAVMTEQQDLRRRNDQIGRAIPKGVSQSGVFAEAIVNTLIPEHFTELPVPLDAAAVVRLERDARGAENWQVDALRFSPQALAQLIERTAPIALADLVAEWRLGDILPPRGDESLQNHPLLSHPALTVSSHHVMRLPATGRCEALWWIHNPDGRGWPDGAADAAASVHDALSQILDLAGRLASPDPTLLKSAWKCAALPLYAEYKLRDNLAETYYSLISRLLLSPDVEVDARSRELEFLIKICAAFEGYKEQMPGDVHALVEHACKAAVRLRKLLRPLPLGLTSLVRVSYRLRKPANRSDQERRLAEYARIQAALEDGPERKRVEIDGLAVDLGEWPVEETTHFAPQTDLWTGGMGRFADWVANQVGLHSEQRGLIAALDQFAAGRFTELRESASQNATVLVAFSQSAENARTDYERTLDPFSKLFGTILHDLIGLASAEREKGRAEWAEMLVIGTSHTLKIPIRVAEKCYEKGDYERAHFLVSRCLPIMSIGQYIHDRERKRNRSGGTFVSSDRVKWRPIVSSVHPASDILDEAACRRYFEDAWQYVRARDDGDSDEVSKWLRLLKDEPDRFSIAFRPEGARYCLWMTRGPAFGNDSPESGVYVSVLLELLANAISYARRKDPRISLEVKTIESDAHKLRLTIRNNADAPLPWKSKQEILWAQGFVGLKMAMWGCMALGWEPEVSSEQTPDGYWIIVNIDADLKPA